MLSGLLEEKEDRVGNDRYKRKFRVDDDGHHKEQSETKEGNLEMMLMDTYQIKRN